MSIYSYLRGVTILFPKYLFFPHTGCSNFLVHTAIYLVAVVRYVLQSLKCNIKPYTYMSTSCKRAVF